MAGELSGKTILLVDDDRDILTAIKAALEDLGPEIIAACDGNQAVELAEKKQPDLIILDMMLPKRSGFLVAEKIKRPKAQGTPPKIIMITGNPGSRHKVYAESLGVDKYLNKPFRMEVLIEAVKELLR